LAFAAFRRPFVVTDGGFTETRRSVVPARCRADATASSPSPRLRRARSRAGSAFADPSSLGIVPHRVPLLRRARGCPLHGLVASADRVVEPPRPPVPSSWFRTTSTAFSIRGFRACCSPVPDLGFAGFRHGSGVPSEEASAVSALPTSAYPSKVSLAGSRTPSPGPAPLVSFVPHRSGVRSAPSLPPGAAPTLRRPPRGLDRLPGRASRVPRIRARSAPPGFNPMDRTTGLATRRVPAPAAGFPATCACVEPGSSSPRGEPGRRTSSAVPEGTDRPPCARTHDAGAPQHVPSTSDPEIRGGRLPKPFPRGFDPGPPWWGGCSRSRQRPSARRFPRRTWPAITRMTAIGRLQGVSPPTSP
jgi:hypothetical protein